MPVQWFTLRNVAPFPSVTFDGANFDEVAEFVREFAGPGRTMIRDGALVVRLRDCDQVVEPGWSVSVRDGYLCASTRLVRDLEWDRTDPPG